MTIIRAPRPERNFYMLDKAISEDKRLSWSARGILIFLLGKPDHWKVSVPALVNETADAAKSTGRDAVYNLLGELISTGYVQRVKRADGALEYIVSEPNPENPDVAAKPLPEKPDPEKPDPEKPDPEKPDPEKPDPEKPDPEKPDPENQDALVSTDKAVRTESKASTDIAAPANPPSAKSKKQKRAEITLQAFIDDCKAAGEKAMRDDDPIVKYADDANIPFEMLNLAWVVFKDKFIDSGAKKIDWRAQFRTYVKNGWLRLWFFDANGNCKLTTAGEQARRVHLPHEPHLQYTDARYENPPVNRIAEHNQRVVDAFLAQDARRNSNTVDMDAPFHKPPELAF
jgi:hypothetical protein